MRHTDADARRLRDRLNRCDTLIVNGLPITIHGQGILSSGPRMLSDGAGQEDGRVMPVTTDTIVGAIQTGSIDPLLWISIVGPIIGGILATAGGALFTVWRDHREQEQRCMHIASGLWVDLFRTHRYLGDFIDPTNREETQKVILRWIESHNRSQEPYHLYPRHGIFATRYADITALGAPLTVEIESLYHRLDVIECYFNRMSNDPQERAKILERDGPTSIYGIIDDAKFTVNYLENKLEKRMEKHIGQLVLARLFVNEMPRTDTILDQDKLLPRR